MNMKLRKLLPLFVLGAALVPTFLFAQEAVEPAAEAATEAVSEDSFLDTLAQGGWVMWPLLFCSIALVWLTVDGYMRSMIKRMFPPAHIEQIRTLFQSGDYRGAYEFCKANPSTLSDVVRMGVVFLPDGKTMTEEAIFSEISRIKAGFDARISYLSVIGVCAPMVGLLGTVTFLYSSTVSNSVLLETNSSFSSGIILSRIFLISTLKVAGFPANDFS